MAKREQIGHIFQTFKSDDDRKNRRLKYSANVVTNGTYFYECAIKIEINSQNQSKKEADPGSRYILMIRKKQKRQFENTKKKQQTFLRSN